jgi:hypothetical protein
MMQAALPPIGKQSRYPHLVLTVLHSTERGHPRNGAPIELEANH